MNRTAVHLGGKVSNARPPATRDRDILIEPSVANAREVPSVIRNPWMIAWREDVRVRAQPSPMASAARRYLTPDPTRRL